MLIHPTRAVRLVATLFFSVLASAVFPAVAGACEMRVPADVLGCYADAYSRKDLEAYDALLSDTFVLRARSGEELTRKEDLEMATKMFGHVESMTLTFGSEFVVEADRGGNSWRFVNVEFELEATTNGAEPRTFEATETVDVVVVRSAEGGFKIAEWIQHQPPKRD